METVEQFKVITTHYIVGAIGVVTAIAWKDSFKSIAKSILPDGSEIKAGLINAIIMTIILLLVILILPSTIKRLPHEAQELIAENIKNKRNKQLAEQNKKIEQLNSKIKRLEYINIM